MGKDTFWIYSEFDNAMKTELLKRPKEVSSSEVRKAILEFEKGMSKVPGVKFGDDVAPLKHTFTDGLYVREITMPKGMILTSKIHKTNHPYFVLKGDVSVLTEKGVIRIKAPYSGITKAGTKRVLYIHEETVWTTVHVTKETDLKKIEEQIIAKTFAEIPHEETLKLKEEI